MELRRLLIQTLEHPLALPDRLPLQEPALPLHLLVLLQTLHLAAGAEQQLLVAHIILHFVCAPVPRRDQLDQEQCLLRNLHCQHVQDVLGAGHLQILHACPLLSFTFGSNWLLLLYLIKLLALAWGALLLEGVALLLFLHVLNRRLDHLPFGIVNPGLFSLQFVPLGQIVDVFAFLHQPCAHLAGYTPSFHQHLQLSLQSFQCCFIPFKDLVDCIHTLQHVVCQCRVFYDHGKRRTDKFRCILAPKIRPKAILFI